MSSSKRTQRRGTRFPYYDITVSIQLVERIKEGGVDKLDSKTLAKAMEHESDKSSAFLTKVSSAKHYGLITELKEKEGEEELKYYCLSELSKKIITPIDTAEKEEAMRQAFFNFDLWKQIYDKFEENKKLPVRSTLENLLQREHGISPVSKSRAYDVFVDSGKTVGLFKETEEGITYADLGEKEEEEESKAAEEDIRREERIKLPPITTSINVTINVDTKDETSVKNFIYILESIARARNRKK